MISEPPQNCIFQIWTSPMVQMTRGPVLTYQPGPIINIWYLNYWPGTIILWTFIKYLIVHIWTWLIVSDILNLSDFVSTCEVAILYLHNEMSPSGEKVNEIFNTENSESEMVFSWLPDLSLHIYLGKGSKTPGTETFRGGGGGYPLFPLRKNPIKIGPKTVFLAVHNSSIGDLVPCWLGLSVRHH